MKMHVKTTKNLKVYQDKINNWCYKMAPLKILPPTVKLLSLFIALFSFSASACEIFVLDCGQGNAVVAKYNTETMVFDAGRTAYAGFVKYDDDRHSDSITERKYPIVLNSDANLLSLLVDQEKFTLKTSNDNKKGYKQEFEDSFRKIVFNKGKNTLRTVFVSHPDVDHYKLITEFKLNPNLFVLGGGYDLYGPAFIEYLKGKKILVDSKVNYPTEGALVRYTGDPRFVEYGCFTEIEGEDTPKVDILSVNASRTGDKNKDSMIVKVTQKYSMLITGDAEKETWADAVKNSQPLLQSDILLIPHHGSMTNDSTSLDVLNIVKPKVCLITAGFQYNHPTFDVIDLLLKYYGATQYRTSPHYITFYEGPTRKSLITNAPIFTTIDSGVLKVDISSNDLKITAARELTPTPNTFLDEEGSLLSLDIADDRSFVNYETLKGLDENRTPLKNSSYFGNDVFSVQRGKKESYYYQFGETYLKMKLIAEDDGEDPIEWDGTILDWHLEHPEAYHMTLKYLGVIREVKDKV